tara:strand:+ start:181 stop:1359 length:1179 start_codon:yes stop_codon:yes gene_type:complete
MLSKNISFLNFKVKNIKTKTNIFIKRNIFNDIKNNKNLLNTLSKNYKYNFKKKILYKFKNFKEFNLIGMGGSTLGTEAIYSFLNHKIKKKINFFNNLDNIIRTSRKKSCNIIISKSGNTLEVVTNINLIVKKNDKNLIITENKKNYLNSIASDLNSEIIEHKNFIGGRYSVLSEVGMIPSELMGLNIQKFKNINKLIKSKSFNKSLIDSVERTLRLIKNKKLNSIILNYDVKSLKLFEWYQQLISESLGKKSKGILPLVSSMPKDNHSLMQYYLDGPKINFFTFFFVHDKLSKTLPNTNLLNNYSFLKNKKINEVIYTQKKATENVFNLKKIPFRSFEIKNRNEESLGELFSFFILETILLGRVLNVNPFDQPSVELIKKETKKIFSTYKRK